MLSHVNTIQLMNFLSLLSQVRWSLFSEDENLKKDENWIIIIMIMYSSEQNRQIVKRLIIYPEVTKDHLLNSKNIVNGKFLIRT